MSAQKIADGWHLLPGDGKEPNPRARETGTVGSTMRFYQYALIRDGAVIGMTGYEDDPDVRLARMKEHTANYISSGYLESFEKKFGLKALDLLTPPSESTGLLKTAAISGAVLACLSILKRFSGNKKRQISQQKQKEQEVTHG